MNTISLFFLDLLPTVWFRNTWSWEQKTHRPELTRVDGEQAVLSIRHEQIGRYTFHFEGVPELLFTENETNSRRLFGIEGASPFVKDGINDYIVHAVTGAVNPAQRGTKAAAHYRSTVGPGQSLDLPRLSRS